MLREGSIVRHPQVDGAGVVTWIGGRWSTVTYRELPPHGFAQYPAQRPVMRNQACLIADLEVVVP